MANFYVLVDGQKTGPTRQGTLPLSTIVGALARPARAPTIRVATAAEKAWRSLAVAARGRILDGVSAWLHGRAHVEHLTQVLRTMPRYARGRDLYGVRAGSGDQPDGDARPARAR